MYYTNKRPQAFGVDLKRLNLPKFGKKSVILFWLLNMTEWCKHVHRLELQSFFNFCAAHLSVKLDIEKKLFWTTMSKIRNTGISTHFKSLKTNIIYLQLRVLEWKFPKDWITNTWQFSLIFHPLQVIFIHYKSRIATAIRGWFHNSQVAQILNIFILK